MQCSRIAFAGRKTPQKRWRPQAVHFPSPLSDQTEDEHPPHAPESAAMALNSDVLQLIFMHFEKVINKVKDIGSVAKVCTTWRRVVVESPELYDKPLRLKFRASVIDDANGMLARRGCTAPADARMLYIICCEERLTQQIEREERKLPRSTRARARAEHDLEVLHSSGHELTQATKTLHSRQAALRAARGAQLPGHILNELRADVRAWQQTKSDVQRKHSRLYYAAAANDIDDNVVQRRIRIMKLRHTRLRGALCWAGMQAMGPAHTRDSTEVIDLTMF